MLVKMYALISVRDEIESLNIEDVLWDQVMMVDPRDYVVSTLNVRTEDPERELKSLEDSILESRGFRYPLLSDENKHIIDGGRRWRVAMKHMLKVPVRHKRYGDNDIERVFDSIEGNTTTPNTPVEVGRAVNILVELGLPISQIAERLGKSYSAITMISAIVVAPKEIIPEEIPEAQEIWKNMTVREKKRFKTVALATDLPVEERIKQLREFTDLPYSEQDAVAKDLKDGLPVDMESRLDIIKESYDHWEHNIASSVSRLHKADCRARAWESRNTYQALMIKLHVHPEILSQEEYIKWGLKLSDEVKKELGIDES